MLTSKSSKHTISHTHIQHPLCTGQFQWPQLRVLFLQHELVEMETQCEAYRSEVSRCLLTISNQMKQEVCVCLCVICLSSSI